MSTSLGIRYRSPVSFSTYVPGSLTSSHEYSGKTPLRSRCSDTTFSSAIISPLIFHARDPSLVAQMECQEWKHRNNDFFVLCGSTKAGRPAGRGKHVWQRGILPQAYEDERRFGPAVKVYPKRHSSCAKRGTRETNDGIVPGWMF